MPSPSSSTATDDRFGEQESPRHSGLKIEVTVSVGYTRQRAGLEESDRWEAGITTILLLVFGAAVVIWFVYTVVTRLMNITAG